MRGTAYVRQRGWQARATLPAAPGFYRKYPNVFERPITNERARQEFGIIGPAHFVATHEQLIEKYAPAWILSKSWPPARPGQRP